MKAKVSSDLLRGHTDTIVLGALLKGDSYGYEIHRSIMEKTNDEFELKEATLYSSYRRLEQEGCIIAYWGDETKGSRRKYYQITDKGRELYRQNRFDWERSQHLLDKLLEGNLK